MLSNYQWIFLQNLAKLITYAESIGLKLTATWLKRDLELQKKMVANGLSKTLDSKHLKSVAIDLNVFKNNVYTTKKEDIEVLGIYWESLHESLACNGSVIMVYLDKQNEFLKALGIKKEE
jgi:hypothetical protein